MGRSHVNYGERHVLVNIAFNFETQRRDKKIIFDHIVFHHKPGNVLYDWLGNSAAVLVLVVVVEPGEIGQPVCQQQIDAKESHN